MCAFCVHLRPSHLCHLMPFYASKFGAIPQVNCICLVSARRSLILSWVRLQSAFRPRGEQRRHADSWLQSRSRAWSLTGTLMKMIKKDEEWWRMMNRMGMTSRNRIIRIAPTPSWPAKILWLKDHFETSTESTGALNLLTWWYDEIFILKDYEEL